MATLSILASKRLVQWHKRPTFDKSRSSAHLYLPVVYMGEILIFECEHQLDMHHQLMKKGVISDIKRSIEIHLLQVKIFVKNNTLS